MPHRTAPPTPRAHCGGGGMGGQAPEAQIHDIVTRVIVRGVQGREVKGRIPSGKSSGRSEPSSRLTWVYCADENVAPRPV